MPVDDFLGLFLEEARELLQGLETGLMSLEARQGDGAHLAQIFRAAHTLKGGAGMVGLRPIAEFGHGVEAVLDKIRFGSVPVTPEAITLLLASCDHLGAAVNAAAKGEAQPIPPAGLVEALADLASGRAPSPAPPASAEPGATIPQAPASKSQERAAESAPATPAKGPSPSDLRAATIAFPEVLDAAAAEEMRGQFLSAIERGCDPVRIDLRATRDLDVQGLALLAAIPRHVARHGGPHLRLAGASTEMETVLGVTGLRESYETHRGSTPEDA